MVNNECSSYESENCKYAVFIGRFTPLHVGHMNVIDTMIKTHGLENCLLMIGSSNTPLSFRVLFDYKTRRRWLKRIYPDMQIIGMPDSAGDDTQWFQMLEDYCELKWPETELNDYIFYGGNEEDVKWYYENGLNVKIIDRFSGEFNNVSATNIRQLLLLPASKQEVKERVSNLLDDRIAMEIIELFNKQIKKLDQLR